MSFFAGAGEVIDLTLRGDVYEPELIVPGVEWRDRIPLDLEDGSYITGLSFERVRSAPVRHAV